MISAALSRKIYFVFVALLSILISTSPAHGDVVRILNSAQEALQARVDLIQQAKTSIKIQYYGFDDDEISKLFLALLRQTAVGQPGRDPVEIKMIVDSVANNINPILAKTLADAHIQIKVYHRFNLFHLIRSMKRMHDKDIIVDGTKIITGGRNIGDDYYQADGNPMIDRDVYAAGENAAQAANDYFDALWNSQEVEDFRIPKIPQILMRLSDCQRISQGDVNARCLRDYKLAKAINDAPAALDRLLSERNPRLPIQLNTQNDWSEGERNVPVKFLHDAPGKKYSETGTYNEIIELLKSADDNIVIENPYLIPSREMMKVFKMLTDPNRPSLDANRPPHAVKIRILTNSLKAGASGMLAQAGYESIKKELLDMHIDIWETKDRFIHAKSFAIDDKISIVGSFNTDIRSQKLNTEVALAIFDPEINQELRTSMESHLTESYELDPYGYPMDDRQRYPQTSRKLVGELRLFKLFLPFYKSAL